MKELEKTYNPADIEGRLYEKWLNKKYFQRGGCRGSGSSFSFLALCISVKKSLCFCKK